jgi:hypothetical protein
MANTISILNEGNNLEVDLKLDVIDQESYSGDVELPRHPVEEGVSVTDHVRPLPRPLEVRGGIGEVDASTAADDTVGRDRARLIETLERLEELRLSGDLFTVVTPLQFRESMHLKSYKCGHSKEFPGTLDVTLNFEEMRVVSPQRVKVKIPKKGPDRTKGGSKDGNQVARPADEDSTRKSLAKRFIGAIRGSP